MLEAAFKVSEESGTESNQKIFFHFDFLLIQSAKNIAYDSFDVHYLKIAKQKVYLPSWIS